MSISADRLADHLAKGLVPAYLVVGDEPLLIDEVLDALRERLRAEGFEDRESYVGSAQGFDWDRIAGSANMSLFASRRIVEVRLPTGKPGAKGARALADLAAGLDADTCLIVITPRLSRRDQAKAEWFKAVAQAGDTIDVRAVPAGRLPEWIGARMRARGLTPDAECVRVLVERVEGNLLAANQEIEKLLLLNGPGPVDGEAVARAVADSARFDVYDLSDAALAGDARRAVRVLDGLRAEGVGEPLVLWALARELRVLGALFAAREAGQSTEQVFRRHRVWQERKTALRRAGARLRTAEAANGLLRLALRCETILKGQIGVRADPNDRWRAITGLVMGVCGVAQAPLHAAL